MPKSKAKRTQKPKIKLTKMQQQYRHEFELLKRRAKYWEQKYGINITLPEKVTKPRKKDITNLKQMRWDKVSKEHYENAGRYIPPIEQDFYDQIEPPDIEQPEWNRAYGELSPEPAITEEEMEAWLEEKIEQIVNPTLLERERAGAKQTLRNILYSAKESMGTVNFYKMLQEPETAAKLEDAATRYINSYRRRNGTDGGDAPLETFAETLNANRPINDEDSYELQMYGTMSFDYSGTDYD